MNIGVSVDNFRNIVEQFLRTVDFDVAFEAPRQAVLDEVNARLKAIPGWIDLDSRYIRVGYMVVRLMVPHLLDAAQVEASIFYVLGTIIDDQPLRFTDGITFEGGRLIKKDHIGYHYSSAIFESIQRLKTWYEPFVVSMIFRSFFDWMVFLPHKTQHAEGLAAIQSPDFIDYMRSVTVVADATSCVAFTTDMTWNDYIHVIPIMNVFVTEVNNLLSCYKELSVGQGVCSVITQRQKLRQQPIEDVIQESCNTCIETTEKLYSAPVSLKQRLRQWVAGYVRFYLEVERYRLKELLDGQSRGVLEFAKERLEEDDKARQIGSVHSMS